MDVQRFKGDPTHQGYQPIKQRSLRTRLIRKTGCVPTRSSERGHGWRITPGLPGWNNVGRIRGEGRRTPPPNPLASR